MKNELIKKAEALIAKAEVAALTSIDENGYPRTVTMSNIKPEGINTLWFSTGTNSNKTKNFIKNSKASVCISTNEDNVTLIGDVSIVDDVEIKKQLWADWFIKHFTLGIDDPNYCILKFESKYIQIYIEDNFVDYELK